MSSPAASHRWTIYVPLAAALLALPAPSEATIVQGTTVIDGHTYDTWRDPAETFQIVCQQPCPIDTNLLLVKYDGFVAAKAQLVALFGIDVLPARAPVDLHLNADAWCGAYDPSGASGTSGNYPVGVATSLRGYTCSWEHEKQAAGTLSVPFVIPDAGTIEAQLLVVHEYGHVIFNGRHANGMEEWVRYASHHVSASPPITDPCDPFFDIFAHWVFDLCQQNGLSPADIAPAFTAMAQLHQDGLGYYADTRTSVFQLRQLLNTQLGNDTLATYLGVGFHPATAGDAVTFEPVGATHVMGGGFLTVRVPPNAVAAATPVKLDTPGGYPFYAPVPDLDHRAVFDLVPAAHRESAPAPPAHFAELVRVAVVYDGGLYPAGTDLSTLRLFQEVATTGGGTAWRRIRASWVSGGHVVADITRTGTFAVLPDAP